MWCIPPDANAEFVWRMEDVLAVYVFAEPKVQRRAERKVQRS
jgi:hypothetical protein